MKNLKKVAWKDSRPPFSYAPIFIPMPKLVSPGLCSQLLHLNDSRQSGQGPLQLGYSQPIDPHQTSRLMSTSLVLKIGGAQKVAPLHKFIFISIAYA